ncbi:hypothetical protein NDU88_001015 [Pleurodeles waltl]|uniref:Uncharacterized protein n=1 Tax=Pleurodeles waltl TaxID=8319 RepID=A0AAV7NBE0_PLEWA|nr:hypothetical protein NDU88_001015 [Pleurodeles waltl]
MTWECPRLRPFWGEVICRLNNALHRHLDTNMETCLLGLFGRPRPKKAGNGFIDLALTLAKRRISMSWKSAEGPCIQDWTQDVTRCYEMGKREESRGMQRKPLAPLWAEVMDAWEDGAMGTVSDTESGTDDSVLSL